MFSNKHATLTHYKDSLNGKLKDYVIRFGENQTCAKQSADIAFVVFKQLVKYFHATGTNIAARLVALVQYVHTETEEVRTYFHGSYSSEIVNQSDDFFYTHMLKIAERMDSFNRNGSNLKIHGIKEIHIHITEWN